MLILDKCIGRGLRRLARILVRNSQRILFWFLGKRIRCLEDALR